MSQFCMPLLGILFATLVHGTPVQWTPSTSNHIELVVNRHVITTHELNRDYWIIRLTDLKTECPKDMNAKLIEKDKVAMIQEKIKEILVLDEIHQLKITLKDLNGNDFSNNGSSNLDCLRLHGISRETANNIITKRAQVDQYLRKKVEEDLEIFPLEIVSTSQNGAQDKDPQNKGPQDPKDNDRENRVEQFIQRKVKEYVSKLKQEARIIIL